MYGCAPLKIAVHDAVLVAAVLEALPRPLPRVRGEVSLQQRARRGAGLLLAQVYQVVYRLAPGRDHLYFCLHITSLYPSSSYSKPNPGLST